MYHSTKYSIGTGSSRHLAPNRRQEAAKRYLLILENEIILVYLRKKTIAVFTIAWLRFNFLASSFRKSKASFKHSLSSNFFCLTNSSESIQVAENAEGGFEFINLPVLFLS